MNVQTGPLGDMRETWQAHRGPLRVRAFLAAATLAGAVGAFVVADASRPVVVTVALLAAGAALIHPMALVAMLGLVVLVAEEAAGGIGWTGPAIAVAGLLLLQWRDARGLPRPWTIAIVWVGLVVISPWLFLVLAVPPAVSILVRRREEMRHQPTSISSGKLPPGWEDTVEQMRVLGYRYAGSIWFGFAGTDERSAAVVFRLGDGRGWLLGTDGWMVGHVFGDRSFYSSPVRWTVTLPHELGQHVQSTDFAAMLVAHRRVLARLAREGIRPDRLSDEETVAFLIRQYELDGAARRSAGWSTVFRLLYDDERNVRQRDEPRCLLDSARGHQRLDEWATQLAV